MSVIILSVMLLLCKISCSDIWFIEQKAVVLAVFDWHLEISVCSYIFYAHHQDHHKLPFHPAKDEGLFSTCSSHMIVVFITYGSCIFIYVKPSLRMKWQLISVCQYLLLQLPPLNPVHLYTEEQASERNFYRFNHEIHWCQRSKQMLKQSIKYKFKKSSGP